VQQFDANGARVGSIVELNGASNANFGSEYTYPYVAALTGGGYAITWMEYTDTNGSDDYTVFVQQFLLAAAKWALPCNWTHHTTTRATTTTNYRASRRWAMAAMSLPG
jgi:hypothetical protein